MENSPYSTEVEFSKIREKLDKISEERQSDRMQSAESSSIIRIEISKIESRLKSVEDSMIRIGQNSSWLIKLILGAIAVAFAKFVLSGGLNGF